MEQGSGEYFVRIGVGSPPTSQYMVVDSGSDISDPLFDPEFSASFSAVSCSSTACDRLAAGNTASSCGSGRCRYEVSYGDGSYTKGTLALETITFHDSAVVHDVAIGCGHSNRGMFVGAAGLLGLGGGSMSFVGQLGGQAGGAFTYCLVSRGSSSGSGSHAFVAQTRDLPRSASVSIFDTCYDLNGFVTVRVPTVSFYFSEGPVLTLPAKNFLIPVDESGTFCLAFAASASKLSIIGNVQQQGIQISVDGANGFVGFGPNVC
ncbi:Protein ASPARTIC PROTEASE IN GUARD CELL 2 [Linum grandiflorum]